jgi:hypothetical protein
MALHRADRGTDAQRQATSIHRRLALGTISRAARDLEQSPLAPMGAATFEALRDLHPQEAAPPAATNPGLAYQVSAAGLQRVLCTLPRGSAAGLRGWTYKHIRTAATAPAHGFQAVLQMLNVLLAGTLPYIAELLDASLIGIQKRGRGGGGHCPPRRFGTS